jgi:hypothetical protein
MTTDFFGLFNPPGRYGKVINYGRTTAVTLTGSPEFRAKGYNLFASFGSTDSTDLPVIRKADRPDTDWFCLPLARIESAVRLYLYGQLRQAAPKREIRDEEGDLLEIVCDTEPALWEEASTLAAWFVQEMPADWDAIPADDWVTLPHDEYTLGEARCATLPVGRED